MGRDLKVIAVTGASGFIGQAVISALIDLDVEIVAISRDRARLAHFSDQVKIMELDINSSGDDCFERIGRPDVLIHLAWDGLPNYNSLHHFEHELSNQYAFLQKVISGGLKSLLVAGTCFEYGDQSGALSEAIETRPTNPYGFAKDVLRRKLEYLKQETPFNMVWARLFYLFGEGQAESSLYSLLQKAIAADQAEFNMSGGEQLRDFLSISDVASSLVSLAQKQTDFGVVNICSGIPKSVRSLVEEWLQQASCDMKLNLGYYPYPAYEPMAFWGDRTKLDACLAHQISANHDGLTR